MLIPATTEQAESLYVEDSAEYDAKLSIAGNSEQESREGYNLIDLNNISGYALRGDPTDSLYGNPVCGNGIRATTDFILVDPLSDYYVGIYDTEFIIRYYFEYDENKKSNAITLPYTPVNAQNKLITTKSITKYIRVCYCKQNDSEQFNLSDIKQPIFCKGSTDKPYEQYGATPSPEFPSEIKSCGDSGTINEVVCNKNLFNRKIIIGSVTGTIGNLPDKSGDKNRAKLEGNLLKINGNEKNFSISDKFLFCLYEFDEDGICVSNNYGKTFVNKIENALFNESTKEIALKFKKIDNTNFTQDDLNNVKFQIEDNTTATDYVEHQEQLITMPTQQEILEGDYFDWENNEEVHTWGKIILDGTEALTISGNIAFYSGATANIVTPRKNYVSGIGKCNQLKLLPYYIDGSNQGVEVYSTVNTFGILMNGIIAFNLGINTVESYKAKLAELYNAGTSIYIYYKLAIPTRLSFTSEQLEVKQQMIDTLKTYKNVTNIYSTDEISPIVQLDYKKDLETLDKQKDDRITALEQLLSTTATSAMLLDNMQTDLESEVI